MPAVDCSSTRPSACWLTGSVTDPPSTLRVASCELRVAGCGVVARNSERATRNDLWKAYPMRQALLMLLMAVSALGADVKTGGSKAIEVDGKYHVWTDRVGPAAANAKMRTLHGGPRSPHHHLDGMERS